LTQPPVSTPLLGEYWIDRWEKRPTPRAILENLDAWNDDEGFFQLDEAFNDEVFSTSTKAGGLPYWTGNGPSGFPGLPFEYLAQFGTLLHCDGPVPTPDEARTMIRYNHPEEDGGHVYLKPNEENKGVARHLLQVDPGRNGFYGDWANLGSDGTGFLYIDRSADPIQVVWFWNR